MTENFPTTSTGTYILDTHFVMRISKVTQSYRRSGEPVEDGMHVSTPFGGWTGASEKNFKTIFYQIRIFDGLRIFQFGKRISRATQTSILILVDTKKNDYGKVLWCFNRTLVAIIYLSL